MDQLVLRPAGLTSKGFKQEKKPAYGDLVHFW